MKTLPLARRSLWFCLILAVVGSLPAYAGPRDAAAVLNRCGRPLEGDHIILEDTVAGGRRILSYERGVMHFDKVGANGWTFAYGSHKKDLHLDEQQMGQVMPCFSLAMADSMAPLPLPPETPTKRVAASMRQNIKLVMIWAAVIVLVCGVIIFVLPRRETEEAYED